MSVTSELSLSYIKNEQVQPGLFALAVIANDHASKWSEIIQFKFLFFSYSVCKQLNKIYLT